MNLTSEIQHLLHHTYVIHLKFNDLHHSLKKEEPILKDPKQAYLV